MSALAEPNAPAYTPAPVDTTDPHAICARLAVIEDELAYVSNQLARAAFWRKSYNDERTNLEQELYAQTEGTIPERKAQLHSLLLSDPGGLLGRQSVAEAKYAQYSKTFDGLDTRRSILQSCLKVHVREQTPQHGQGAHQR